MTETEVLIVGAGICGVTLARNLQKPNVILEKSRGVGGRIATRRIEDQGFDHGALKLYKSEELLKLFSEAGLSPSSFSESELYLKGGMTQLLKNLSSKLDIRKGVKVEKLAFKNGAWEVLTDSGDTFRAKKIVVTAPLPQSLELLQKNDITYPEKLSHIHYSKAVMALIITKELLTENKSLHQNLESVAPMNSRNLHPTGYVVRATPEYSEKVFERPDEENLKAIVEFFLSMYPKSSITYSEFKKWRYVLPTSVINEPFLEISAGLFLTGDAFLRPDVSGSLLGATSLASKL